MLSMKRWMNSLVKMKRRKFFRKLIVTSVLIAVLPNLAVNLFSYFQVTNIVEEETGSNKLQYLNQTINAFEMILNRIKENSNLLALNRSFQSFENFPNGRYYEDLQGELPREDLAALYSYLETKKNTFHTINSFKLSNEFVDSVYFYDSSKDLVITSDNEGNNRQFPLDDFYDRGWYDEFVHSQHNPVFMDTRAAALQYPSAEKQVVSILYKSNKGKNAIIVNLDAALIHREIFSKLNHEDDIYVVSSSGTIVFGSSIPGVQQFTSLGLPEDTPIVGGTGSYVTELANSQKLISYSTSPMMNWTFVNISDMKAFSQGMAAIKQTITWSVLILVLLSIALAYLSSKNLYKPISYLNTLTIGKMEQRAESRGEQSDELLVIGSFVQSTIDERNFYKQKLEESLPLQRERFKHMLLHPNSWTLDEIEEKIVYLGLAIDTDDLVVLLLGMDEDHSRSSGQDMLTIDLWKIQVMDAIKNSWTISSQYFLVDIEKDKIAMVFNRCGLDQKQVFRLSQQMLDAINGQLQSSFTIGVGRACRNVKELPRAYGEAAEALKYQMLFGRGYVISIDDILIDNGTEFIYPRQKEELLLGLIKTARKQEALQVFDDLASEIGAQKHKLHYNQIQPIFIQLLTGIRNLFSQLGTDIGEIIDSDSDPYRELLDQDSVEKISDWFHVLIERAAEYIELEMNAKGNRHITKVIEILERDYSKDISLNSVAEQLKLNPVYISRLFKQSTGQLFVDYLKQIRIDRSKHLLVQGNMKINEVGRQVGFGTSHYYIKVFKDLTGLTPGEYKRINSS